MDKEPVMQPMVETNLEVEHPALIAPTLDLIDPAMVGICDPQPDKAESVGGEILVGEPKSFAAASLEIGQHLFLKESGKG